MTVEAWETRQAGRYQRVFIILLAVTILVPLGVLFFQHHGHQSDRRSAAIQERHGIAYLRALGQLTIALTDAQSAAVRGEPLRWEPLDEALTDVDDVDSQYGDELRVGERWSQLRGTIERAANTEHRDGRAAYAAYEEATGLLLGLHDRLRDTAGLVRDPDQDAHHLQSAAAGSLPETVVALGRLADQVALLAGVPARERAASGPEISAAIAAVTVPADEFVRSVQSALDSTENRSMSGSVLGKYDRFLRAKDVLVGAVSPDGDAPADPGLLAGIRTEQQAAADDLSTALLTELDALVESRVGALTRDRWLSVVMAVLGVLLVLGLVALTLLRGAQPPARRAHPGELPAGGDGRGPGGRTPELSRSRMSISDSAASYEPGHAAPAAGDRLAGEVLGVERADVR